MDNNRQINRRLNDFPELQIGYPERNDVRNPNVELERMHASVERPGLSSRNDEQRLPEPKGNSSK
jgi:hypothetical protein